MFFALLKKTASRSDLKEIFRYEEEARQTRRSNRNTHPHSRHHRTQPGILSRLGTRDHRGLEERGCGGRDTSLLSSEDGSINSVGLGEEREGEHAKDARPLRNGDRSEADRRRSVEEVAMEEREGEYVREAGLLQNGGGRTEAGRREGVEKVPNVDKSEADRRRGVEMAMSEEGEMEEGEVTDEEGEQVMCVDGEGVAVVKVKEDSTAVQEFEMGEVDFPTLVQLD